jgi:hypothetical protein
VGYFLVGLTFIYAISGLALNHIEDLGDPSFIGHEVETVVSVRSDAPDDELAAETLSQLAIEQQPENVYRAGEQLEISLGGDSIVTVDLATGATYAQYTEPRFFLRVANWLHANRGKKAWTYFADGYAILLLLLATSGLFMIRGRKGLIGRGAILVTLGIALPVIYIQLAGGP